MDVILSICCKGGQGRCDAWARVIMQIVNMNILSSEMVTPYVYYKYGCAPFVEPKKEGKKLLPTCSKNWTQHLQPISNQTYKDVKRSYLAGTSKDDLIIQFVLSWNEGRTNITSGSKQATLLSVRLKVRLGVKSAFILLAGIEATKLHCHSGCKAPR